VCRQPFGQGLILAHTSPSHARQDRRRSGYTVPGEPDHTGLGQMARMLQGLQQLLSGSKSLHEYLSTEMQTRLKMLCRLQIIGQGLARSARPGRVSCAGSAPPAGWWAR
jgi:hypothetical protein